MKRVPVTVPDSCAGQLRRATLEMTGHAALVTDEENDMGTVQRPDWPIPRWLRFVLLCDRAGSSAYIGAGFFFAPVLALLSPWPAVTTALWVLIGLAGLWLGLLGLAMATGLAMVLRKGGEIPEDYWRSILRA